jgi:hypothetical protein
MRAPIKDETLLAVMWERFPEIMSRKPQRTWVGLTDDDIFKAILPLCDTPKLAQSVIDMSMDEYQAIEAKLKEKNT